jgi:hypothetical protein
LWLERLIYIIINPQNKIMSNFNVPTRDEVSENNQAIFDNLEKVLICS